MGLLTRIFEGKVISSKSQENSIFFSSSSFAILRVGEIFLSLSLLSSFIFRLTKAMDLNFSKLFRIIFFRKLYATEQLKTFFFFFKPNFITS